MNRGSASGFTLIEIMVVVVIIGLLAGLVVPKVMRHAGTAKTAKVAADIGALQSALRLYKLEYSHYPTTEEGLNALLARPEGELGGYLDVVPNDPWGKPYHYLHPGRHAEIDIWSWGADGQPGGDGENADIQSWQSTMRDPVEAAASKLASRQFAYGAHTVALNVVPQERFRIDV